MKKKKQTAKAGKKPDSIMVSEEDFHELVFVPEIAPERKPAKPISRRQGKGKGK